MLELPNGLANGVRTASDFLMALQLTGAAKTDSLANMQLRLPVVVVGGGLTAIDTATESLAYYPVQVEKFLARYEALAAVPAARRSKRHGRPTSARSRTNSSRTRARSAPSVRRRSAKAARRASPSCCRRWGGVTIAYRRRLIDSPAYTLNHEEVEKALEEGIRFAEGLTPLAVEVDADGRACALEVSEQHNDGDGVWHEYARVTLPARTILIAAGTQPNTVLAREDAAHFHLDGKFFRLLDEEGAPVTPVKGLAKPAAPAVLTDIRADGRATSFFGDLHPSYAGNVVKAMASAKQGAPIVTRMLAQVPPASADDEPRSSRTLDRDLRATVVRVERLTPTIVEVVVHAPAAARRFRPGQFYRLQNFEALAARARRHAAGDGRPRADRRVGRPGARARVDDRARNGRIVGPVRGAATRASRVILMGPDRHRRPKSKAARRCVLAGGGLGNAVLFSIGQAFREAGLEGALFRRLQEDASTATRSPTSRRPPTSSSGAATRRRDSSRRVRRTARSSATSSRRCARTRAARSARSPSRSRDCDRLIAIGSDAMMAAVGAARHDGAGAVP